jgi:hypothetical protein
MCRKISCLVLLGFFSAASVAMARTGDSGTPSHELANQPKVKSDNATKTRAPENEKEAVESELQDLRDLIQSQTEELHELRARLAAVEAGVTPPKETPASPAGVQPSTPAITPAVTAMPSAPMQGAAHNMDQNKSPLFFKIGSAEFSPGGFLDFTTFYRSTNVGSGIATAFGTIPFSNLLPQGRMSETHLSAQYSRLSLMVKAPINDSTAITGYVESDFLGFLPANAYITANSDSMRLRVYWADVRHGKWEVLAGQAWSLITPNRVGLSPYTPDVFYSLDEDPNFQVGLTWLRQPQVRVVYHPTSNWAVGVSAENPQQFVPASVVFPSTFFITQFDNGSASTLAPSAATNTAVPNLHPDIIVKTAFDAHPAGHSFHIELAGLIRSFRVLNDLTPVPTINTITGGGGSFSFNYELIHNLHIIVTSFYSDGGGRYIFGLGPDVIVRPNGTLSAVHADSGVGGFEYQATPHYMFYGYYGGAYFQRNYGFFPAPPPSTCNGVPGFTCVGFGYPGSLNTSNRTVQEITFGVIPTLWYNENYGRVQIITQYSYLTRSPWSILSTPGSPDTAHTHMMYAGLRYILP